MITVTLRSGEQWITLRGNTIDEIVSMIQKGGAVHGAAQ